MNQMGVWTQAPFADEELAHRLEGAGLDIALLSRYALGASGRGLVSGFTAFDAAAIRGGLRRLASALER